MKAINAQGIETNYNYDVNGFLITISDVNNDLIEAVTYITLDGVNKVNQVTDIYGNQKSYVYDYINKKTIITDSNGNSTSVWYDSGYNETNSSDALGQISVTTYYTENGMNKYGEVKTFSDRNGNVTVYDRDSRGNVTKVTNPDNSYRQYTYDDLNNLISECDENGNYTYYIYDSSKRYLIKQAEPLNGTDVYNEASDQSRFAITSYDYYQLNDNGYTIRGLIRQIKDPEGNIATYTYDRYGNKATSKDNASNITTYTYNVIALLTSTLSPKGELISYAYDVYGNLTDIVLQGGETTHYEYDLLGRKTKEISANIYQVTSSGNVGNRYTYYNNGKIHTFTDAEDNTTTYTYDLYGNIMTEKKPNGCIYSYDYDPLNRITKVYVQDNIGLAKEFLFSYTYSVLLDKNTQITEIKYLNESENATTSKIYNYADKLIKQINPDGGILVTTYNANGLVHSTTDALNKTTYYKYNGMNRLTEQWTPFNEGMYSYKAFSYDKNGNKTLEAVGTDSVPLWQQSGTLLSTSYSYGSDNKLMTVTDAAGGRVDYEYDCNGNISKETRYLGGNNTQFTEYKYNYFGKKDSVIQHVEARDLYGYSLDDYSDKSLTTTYTYDANGNNVTKTTPDNTMTTYTYDKLNRMLSQSIQGYDEYGQEKPITTEYTYDFSGNILTKTDDNGNVTENTYNQRGLLTKVIDPEEGVTAYYYDNAGRQVTKVLPGSYTNEAILSEMSRVEFVYDNMNHIILEKDIYFDAEVGEFKTINAKAYRYDLNGNLTKGLDAFGYENGTGSTVVERIATGYGTTYTYNDNNQLLTVLTPVTRDKGYSYDTLYTYDAAGRKVAETNAAHVIRNYYYDNVGRIIKISIIDTNEKTLQETTYDGIGNILTQTDGNRNTTSYTYNKLGLLRSKTTPGDATISAYTITNQYSLLGQLAYQIDNIGKVNRYTYNYNGQVLSQTEQNYDTSQSITTSNAYDKNGNLRFTTDARGNVIEYTYDSLNRVHQKKQVINNTERITVYSYDKNNNLISTTDWLGNTYTNEYDKLNRLIKKTDPSGVAIEKYQYNSNHVQVKAIDALGNETTFNYDKNNRLLSTTDPTGIINSQTYDAVGNINTKVDGMNNTTTYIYNAQNRLSCVTNAKEEPTYYSYDLNGNVLTVTYANGRSITNTYNVANKLVSETDIDDVSKYDSYTYYSNGSLKTRTDKKGITTTYSYNIHGKLVSESAGTSTTTYTYDNNGNMLSMSDITGTTSRTYDEIGRVLTKTVPNIGTISFCYDIIMGLNPGWYKEITTDPTGNVSVKIYNHLSRLTKVIAGNDITIYTYYNNGNLKNITYNNGFKEEYTYYNNNKLHTLTNCEDDGSIMDSYSYTYDNAGNQLTKYEVINGAAKGTTIYTYDTLNRLLTVTEPSSTVTTYGYDAIGNRIQEEKVNGLTTNTIEYSYNNQNRLMLITAKTNGVIDKTTAYSYDNNGNQLTSILETYVNGAVKSTDSMQTNTYNNKNQLTKTITNDGTEINNCYNAEGYRVSKEVNGDVTHYLYEGNRVILEVDEAGNQVAWNLYGSNLIRRTIANETYYYMYNGHADVTALLTETGTVAANYYYDAFGNVIESTGGVNNNILYAGYQYDNETGLYYLNSRMYDPKIARFLQEDTYAGDIKEPLSLNLYTYCDNNPIRYNDPTGHWKKEVHYDKTYKWVLSEFNSYIDEQSKNIVVYKKDKKGNVKEDKKGNPIVDKTATKKEQKGWIKEQKSLAKDYAKAMASGDEYVDQQDTIFKRNNFTGDAFMFHGLDGLNYTDASDDKNNPYNFIVERKNTATTILTSESYSKKEAITNFIINPAIDILDNKTTSKDASIANIKKDIDNGKYENGSATTYLAGKNATKETASSFVLGMGLHSLQDIQAHGMQDAPHAPSDPNDDTKVDSWSYDKNEELKIKTGKDRITKTETNTRVYINTFLYGDGTEENPGYGSYFFTPYTPSKNKNKR